MRVSLFTALCIIGLSLVGSVAVAQTNLPVQHHKRVLGYQDPETGDFHPVVRHGESPDTTAVTPFTGTIEVKFAIDLVTPVPTGCQVLCSVEVDANSTNANTYVSTTVIESAYELVKPAGTRAICTVNVPYSWTFPTSTTKVPIANTFDVNITAAIVPESTSTTIVTEYSGGVRSSYQPIVQGETIPIAAGHTTTFSAAVTL